jgi:hypothetical protein
VRTDGFAVGDVAGIAIKARSTDSCKSALAIRFPSSGADLPLSGRSDGQWIGKAGAGFDSVQTAAPAPANLAARSLFR